MTLPKQLARVARDPVELDSAIAVLRQTALATVDAERDEWGLHALTGDVIRDHLGTRPAAMRLAGNLLAFGSVRHLDPTLAWDARRWVRAAVRLVAWSLPDDVDDPAAWARMAEVVPHALAVLGHAQQHGVLDPLSARLRNTVGRLLVRRGDHGTALGLLRTAESEAAAVYGESAPATLAFRHDLAEALYQAGDLPEADRLLDGLSRQVAEVFGPEHIEVAMVLNDLGVVRRATGRTEVARRLFTEAAAILHAAEGAGEIENLAPRLNLADLDLDDGAVDDATVRYRGAYRTQAEHLGAEHPQTLIALNNLAEATRLAGDVATAVELHERVLATRRRVLGVDHPATAVSMNNLAVTFQALGRIEEARELVASAVELHGRALGEQHASSRRMTGNLRRLAPFPPLAGGISVWDGQAGGANPGDE